MEEIEITQVAMILNEWNPLGEGSKYVKDLDGYRTEAIDILFHIQLGKGKEHVERIVMEVLNEAFDLTLTRVECSDPARKIIACLNETKSINS